MYACVFYYGPVRYLRAAGGEHSEKGRDSGQPAADTQMDGVRLLRAAQVPFRRVYVQAQSGEVEEMRL